MREGWAETTLGEIAKWSSGGTPRAGESAYYGGDIPWCVIGDLNEGEVVETAAKITELGLQNSSAKIIDPGAVLIAMYGASIGRTGMAGCRMATNQAIASAITFPNLADNDFLLQFLQSQKSAFVDAGQGAAQANISQTVLKSWPILLPPLKEQRRIVDVIESVDNYMTALKTRAETARTARSALLDDLLFNPGPDWVETTLGEIARWSSGGTPPVSETAYYGGDIPWCVIGDLNEGEVIETAAKITELGLQNSSAKIIDPGAVLIAMYGASIGRTGMSGCRMATNQAIASAIAIPNFADNDFLLRFLQSQKSAFVAAGQGAAQANISQTVLKAWPILLPPLAEQRRIVDVIESVDAKITSLERSLENARTLRAALLSDLLSGNHEIPASYDQLLGAA